MQKEPKTDYHTSILVSRNKVWYHSSSKVNERGKRSTQGIGITVAIEDNIDIAMESDEATFQGRFIGDLQNAMNGAPIIENMISGLKDLAVHDNLSCKMDQHLRPTRGNDSQCGFLKPMVTDDFIKACGPIS